ncbi:MAG: VOC family protein [Actinobacteria bacterium]|nr:VOC family protein [Actinomycetota bacterium]
MTAPLAFQVVVDCADPHELADWWARTLGWTLEPTNEEFIAAMVAQGYASDDETRTWRGQVWWATGAAIVQPEPPAGAACTRILFQLVPEAKAGKNRLHLDVRATAAGPDLDATRDELLARGATFLHEDSQGPHRWFTMADPEGNEFCIT